MLRDYLDDVEDVLALVNGLFPGGVALSVISYMELYEGTLQAPDPAAAQRRLTALLETVPMLPVSAAVARRCARLREHLRRDGKRVRQRSLDLIIAATALQYNLTLVTRNGDDFVDLPDIAAIFHSRT